MIETQRLFLKPLSFEQLVKYIKNDGSLEKELYLHPTSRVVTPELKDAIESTIMPNVADNSKNYLFSTLWSIICKDSNKMVGDICLIDETKEQNSIEIGYGTYDDFQNKGYMSEAVGSIVKWLENQNKFGSVIASTNKDNIASCKVLINNGFKEVGASQNLLKWKLTLKNNQ